MVNGFVTKKTMKRIILSLAIIFACLSASALAQSIPPTKFCEADGSPCLTPPKNVIVPNGSISGNTVTITGGGSVTGANPTASVGLSAVNGVATTFLRSDGAPALDQSIAPTWTGQHIHSLSNAAAVAVGPNGNTNPVFRLVTNVSSAATGIAITGNAAGTAPRIAAISSGTNEGITYSVKGAAAHTFIWDAASVNNNWQITSIGSLVGASNAGGLKFSLAVASGASQLGIASDTPILYNSTSTLGSGSRDTGLGRAAQQVIRVSGAAANAQSGAGTFSSVALTPAQIAADTNNYAPGVGWFQRWSSDASRNVTGLVAGVDGQVIEVWNVGAQNIVLINASGSSTSANQFASSTGADLTLLPGKCVMGRYDLTSTKWRVWLCN